MNFGQNGPKYTAHKYINQSAYLQYNKSDLFFSNDFHECNLRNMCIYICKRIPMEKESCPQLAAILNQIYF